MLGARSAIAHAIPNRHARTWSWHPPVPDSEAVKDADSYEKAVSVAVKLVDAKAKPWHDDSGIVDKE